LNASQFTHDPRQLTPFWNSRILSASNTDKGTPAVAVGDYHAIAISKTIWELSSTFHSGRDLFAPLPGNDLGKGEDESIKVQTFNTADANLCNPAGRFEPESPFGVRLGLTPLLQPPLF
jgi:hypothetical protein